MADTFAAAGAPYTVRKNDGGYDVLANDGTLLGFTYKATDQAWSYAPWVIEGVHDVVRGGVGGNHERRRGWRTKADAIREIAIMNSAKIAQAAA